MKKNILFIPYNINYIYIEEKKNLNKFLYLYNDNYFFSININYKQNIKINQDTNTVIIENRNFNNKLNLFNHEFDKFLYSWDNFFFNKIKFTGKGFKWKKKETNLFLFFNRAHKCFFIGNNIILKRLSKSKIIILKNNYKHLIHDSILIRVIRSNNIFTKRGLRFSRQIILKKKGKTASQ
uniref:Ymf60 n=1 Tax=Tetrahymena malaccensis TaxID=5901 RepID=Q09FB3_TETMA|nr:Ymf60 [Tetrahymena malaccensis]ABI51638.1 Ymf60 [Tetrahymena malaccensis]